MKSSSTLFLALLAVQLPCRALEEKSIVAAGDWSQPVAGTVDPQTGRGAHRPLIRGRLLLCESAKNQQTAIYLELQDSGDSWGGTKEIHFDLGGCQLEMRDTKGQPIPPKPSAFSGGVPAALWMSLPCDSTLRMRISPYASFSCAGSEDYFMSGTFTVHPPADHAGIDVWHGTLTLPPMKVVVPKETSAKPPDAIDQLVAKLSATTEWENGAYKPIDLPESAAAGQLIGKVFQTTSPLMANFELIEARWIEIPTAVQKKYLAVLCQTGATRKIVLLQFQSGGWWNRVYDADEPAKADPPLPKEAQAVLDDLNLKAADSAWQGSIDWIERPETRPLNTVDSGEVTAFLSNSKERLKSLGVRVSWNAASRRYEAVVEAKDDPIGRLTKKLNDTHGLWINGISPSLDLPPTASSDEVLLGIIARSGLGTHVRTLELRKDWPIEVVATHGDRFTAALIEVDAGRRIILFRRDGDSWWSRVFELPQP